MGLEDGPFLRALRTYARRNPEGTFADLHQEAVLLEAENSQPRYELACAAVSGPGGIDSRSQGTDWKAELKREILEEVQGQMRELTQEVMKELKSSSPVAQLNHAQPNYVHFQPQMFLLGDEGGSLPRICGMQRGGRSADAVNSQDT